MKTGFSLLMITGSFRSFFACFNSNSFTPLYCTFNYFVVNIGGKLYVVIECFLDVLQFLFDNRCHMKTRREIFAVCISKVLSEIAL